MLYCTEEERIYTANHHMLIFCVKKSGARWMDGWMIEQVEGMLTAIKNLTFLLKQNAQQIKCEYAIEKM